jgi:hypothetical protein
MAGENLIPTRELCIHHNIEISFIHSLEEYGLANIITIEGTGFIDQEQLKEIERMIHLHYDLEVNLEGIDVIQHLLENQQSMQKEMSLLKNKLRFYEGRYASGLNEENSVQE